MGIFVTVYALVAHNSARINYKLNGANVIVSSGHSRDFLANAVRLMLLTVSKRVNAVHVITGASTFVGFFAIALGRVLMIPSVISIFGNEDLIFRSTFSRRLFLLSAAASTAISTNSFATLRLLPPRFQMKSQVLLGGADPDDFCTNAESKDDNTILFVGRLVKRKGLDDLLEAFKVVKNVITDCKLVIVGDGPENAELQRKTVAMNLTDVEFTGVLRGAELRDQYMKCSICVLPSKYVSDDPANEGLGLSLIEASMHSKPLVGTVHGGIPEIIEDGVNGFLVPEGDASKLANCIVLLLSNKDLCKKMGKKAREIAISKFTWEQATKRLLKVYGQQ
jgi:glycosyltransferase involved in cell wall biosynthesis